MNNGGKRRGRKYQRDVIREGENKEGLIRSEMEEDEKR